MAQTTAVIPAPRVPGWALRAGELTSVWVPDERHEAMRELTRARDASRQDLTRRVS